MDKLIRNNRLTQTELLVDETIFSSANGYLGVRGSFTEGYGTNYEYNQTYLNGFYNHYDYFYEENLTGFPQKGQKNVNLLDGTKIEFIVDGTPLNITNCEVLSLERTYDLELGITIRNIHYRMKSGPEFVLKETRFASRDYPELIVINVELSSHNFEGSVLVKSFLQESKKWIFEKNDPRINNTNGSNLKFMEISPDDFMLITQTTKSNLSLASTIVHSEELNCKVEQSTIIAEKEFLVHNNKVINLTKYILHTSDLYDKNFVDRLKKLRAEITGISITELIEKQKVYYQKFWDIAYIKVHGDNNIEALLNYNIFQLNSSGGENYIHNISAKGLSGEGYEGHYFWDTEIYMIPFFTLTNQEKAKNLLMYRYHTMKQAKQEAINLGYTKGVKFPWRTINGDEASPYYPAGSAQFHINSDIAYAIIKYFEVSNDLDFMIKYGFEMMIETALFLKEAVNYNDGFYHLNGVTGPDEYTTVVDDNYYTNQMLQYHFTYLSKFYPKYQNELNGVLKKLGIEESVIRDLKDIADQIYLPFSKELNIYAQDASFLKKKRLDLTQIPEDKYPLLLNFHPLYLYKHQVLKQADTMLSMMLLDYSDMDILQDSFNYYEPITTHDSSLSKCIYSIMAFKLNNTELAYNYFTKVLQTDYLNTHKNTEHGLHVANLGGSYLGFVFGIVGLRIHSECLSIYPIKLKEISGYEFNIVYQGSKVHIQVDDVITISSSKRIKMNIYGNEVDIIDTYQTALSK
ncbi:MAG: glycoside hydrolase family 65 protein [Bacilli bacterium]|nr:glycoside hydrolase family 65 protein [Bacilli bacterium]